MFEWNQCKNAQSPVTGKQFIYGTIEIGEQNQVTTTFSV
jgi:hypothetical protein